MVKNDPQAATDPAFSAIEPLGLLTAQEWRVARLAAEGQSDDEITARIMLAPKTVKHYLDQAGREPKLKAHADLARHFSINQAR
ncbi:MAG TPA: LuxR C-terminal-related transcriptional regulator [Streptosporangiaceae bacterium]|nr:LuxR C-terminal-related transcriptional regulator [Streptosporangiaceae bacterium]